MFLLLIGVAILAYALIDYKKAFLIYLIYQLFWYDQLVVVHIGGRTVFISTFMNAVFFALYFVHGRMKCQNKKFPFKIPIIILAFSMFFTCFFAVAGFASELTRQVTIFVRDFLIIWMIWRIVEKKKDFDFVIKGITIVMFVACIFGLLEYIAHKNPFFDYKSSIAMNEIGNYNYMVNSFSAMARGYRLYSIFEHPIGGGMVFSLYFAFVLNLYIKQKKELPWRNLALITSLLCIPCIILTKMRSVYIFALITAIPIINFKKKRFYKIAGLAMILAVVSWPIISSNFDIFASLFNKKLQETVGGSGLDQRLQQFSAVFSLMKMSPLFGLGEKFQDLIFNSYTAAALSYESLWLLIIPKYGITGIIAYVIYGYFCVCRIPWMYRSIELFFLMLSYWVTYSVTSIPSFRTSIFFFIVFYYIKRSDVYIKAGRCNLSRIRKAAAWNKKNTRGMNEVESKDLILKDKQYL